MDVEGQSEDEDRKAEKTAHGCLLAWQKLVEESMNVTVKNITFVETIESRQLPACSAGHCQDLQPLATTWSSSDAVAF